VKLWTAPPLPLTWPAGLARWPTRSPAAASGLALAMVAVVAALDYATGYELRLAILYLVPIALATWTGGMGAGVLIVAMSSLCWLASFRSSHPYSGDVFFYWEGVVMVTVQITVVLLLARLRLALTQADERFRRVLEELHAAVYVADQDSGSILYANQNLARLINADPRALGAEGLGKRFGLVNLGGQSARHAHTASIEAGFASHEVRDQTSGRWYMVKVGPIPWKGSQRVTLQFITDISEEKHAQALKRQHQEMLHQTSRLAALAEIASSLAHEVNQPLMAIASYNDACLEMLAATGFDQNELTTALQRCREQALRAGRIIGRVRDFIRSRRPSPSQCDINALVLESLELLDSQLEDNAVTTETSLFEALPTVPADRTLLVQVIVNLVQNAIDAMEQAVPWHRQLSVSTARAADGAILVSVGDQGGGIPETISDRLYTPFFTTKPHGLGLGLSICRSVVEAHGGRIWHGANPGSGCTFHFTLPSGVD
jgi:C4-dicarboxylate-specific signal transduction histidine kinase